MQQLYVFIYLQNPKQFLPVASFFPCFPQMLLWIYFIVCIGVSTLSQKHHSPFLTKPALKSANWPSPPPFLGIPPFPPLPPPPPLCWFFMNVPLKVQFFSEPPIYHSCSSLTLSNLLKVTKFLLKISQFEF